VNLIIRIQGSDIVYDIAVRNWINDRVSEINEEGEREREREGYIDTAVFVKRGN